jgi:hypothetical protein
VVAQGAAVDDTGSLPVVLRNMTDGPLSQLDVTGSARDTGGALVGSGESQGFSPSIIQPGQIAIGFVFFEVEGLPKGTTFDLAATGEKPDSAVDKVDLPVVELNPSGTAIVGTLRNDTTRKVKGPIAVNVLCFDDANIPTRSMVAYARPDTAAAGATVTFSADFGDTPPCPRFLVGGTGYAF